MKRKIGFVAAVILVGAFVVACNQKPTEPTATPAPSPTPAATEKPATSDLPSDSVIVEDTGLSQPVDQDDMDHGVVTEGQEPIDETDEAYDALMAAHDEEVIQELMDTGMSREEAESALADSREQIAAEEKELEEYRQRQHEEFLQQLEEDTKADIAKSDAELMEKYGLTTEQWQSMSATERYQWAYEHQQ